jgi:TPP-dependent pyruvate/acetoin dehydrogenase alpha subunit
MITTHTRETLIAFEDRIKAHWEAGELPCLLHLCGGNEDQLLELARDWNPGDWIFSTHRNHYHALLAGVPPEVVEARILAGRSMFMFSRAHNFFSSAILASTTCIAAGVAYEIKQRGGTEKVICFVGDGAEEEGHFYEACIFADAHDLPITFIIEDNNRQVDTPKTDRRGSEYDHWLNPKGSWDPTSHFLCVRRYHYTPTYPHAGSGCKFQITFKPEAIARLKPAA